MWRGSALAAISALNLTLLSPAQADATAQGATGGETSLCAAPAAQVAPALNGDWTLETVLTRVHTEMGSKREDGGPPEPVTLSFADDATGIARIGERSFAIGIHPTGGLAIAAFDDHFRAFADASKPVASQVQSATGACPLRDQPQIFGTTRNNTAQTRLELIAFGPDLLVGGFVSTIAAEQAGRPDMRIVSATVLRRNPGTGE